MSIPPLWQDVGKKKWSPFLVSGPRSPFWAPEHGAAHTLKMVLHTLLKWC